MAEIVTSYDHENNLTLHVVKGILTFNEIVKKIRSYYEDDIVTKNTLWDLTEANISAISTDEVNRLAHFVKGYNSSRRGGKTALVLSEDVDFGIGRMYTTLIELTELQYKVRTYRDIDEARKWILS